LWLRAASAALRPEIKSRRRRIKVERWRIERLIPYAKNARTHTAAASATRLTARFVA
jgi:hypothetical protein